MPKIVDHEARRAELAAALWRVVGRGGVAAATVRAVADEAGWSMGALRHYFASQDELLHFGMATLMERVPARVGAHLTAELTPRERARRLLLELVPTDEEHRVEAVVWLAFLERSRTDAALEPLRTIAWEGERELCRLVVIALLDRPRRPGPAKPLARALEQEAEALHLFADGITLQATAWPGRWTARAMRAAVDRQLDALAERLAA